MIITFILAKKAHLLVFQMKIAYKQSFVTN